MNISSKIKIIAFDADDTLWVNEPYYRETEKKFALLLKDFLPEEKVNKLLLETEIANIELYGYGVKSFVLSMIETALIISNGKEDKKIINQIIDLGKSLINKPLILLEGVKETLAAIKDMGIKLVLATKGDLLDQERKLKNSSLSKCFHHIEIMSHKNEEDYQKLLDRLEISADEFLMIGNSIKSDILPVLSLGSYAVHIPCDTTWEHENVINNYHNHKRFLEIESVFEILPLIQRNQPAFFDSLAQ